MRTTRRAWTSLLLACLMAGAWPGLASSGPAEAPPPAAQPPAGQPDLPEGWKLLYSQSFDQAEALKDFEFSDPKIWRWIAPGDNGCLEAQGASAYRPAVRSPVVIALLRDRLFEDFILECDLLSTAREYAHRDMCLFFGFAGPAQFYYAHLGTKHDTASHNILIVNDKPRAKITKTATEGVAWGRHQWHRVRVIRRVAEGTITVFYDDMQTPVLTAADATFPKGRIGFGSFDDCGLVDNIRIWGPRVEQGATPSVFTKTDRNRVAPAR
jgi:hypothetical protein